MKTRLVVVRGAVTERLGGRLLEPLDGELALPSHWVAVSFNGLSVQLGCLSGVAVVVVALLCWWGLFDYAVMLLITYGLIIAFASITYSD